MRKISISKNISLAGMFAVTMGLFSCNKEEKKETTDTTAGQPTAPTDTTTAAPVEEDSLKDKGIGPVSSVELGAIDKSLAEKGKTIFTTKCSACHKIEAKYVGPALGGITKRRTPEWVMNMMLNPVEMTQKNPIAKRLLEKYLTQMTFQDLTQDDARSLLEYFRSEDEKAK